MLRSATSSLFRARISPLRPRLISDKVLHKFYAASAPLSLPKPANETRAQSIPEPPESINEQGSSSSPREQRIEEFKQILKDWTERTSTMIRRRADGYTARAASTFAQLGSELNKATGYGEIEQLKKRVVTQEQRITAARQAARDAKEEYDKAVFQRANSQREVNDLLQRKSNWTDEDVSRFTSLVRQDHLFEQNEVRAKAAAAFTESEVEREFSELMRVILHRYHEEQIWSDKIRSASTYGSLTVLGLNVLVFVMAILFVEPWKRRKLAQTFEKKVEEMTATTTFAYHERTNEITTRMDKQDNALLDMAQTLHYLSSSSIAVPDERLQHEHIRPTVLLDETASTGLAETRLSAFYSDDMRWLLGTSLVATAIGWLARSWFGQ